MTDGTGTTGYSYDVFGETTSVTDGAGGTVGYAYDADGNTTTISYPGAGNTVTDTYNDIGELTQATDPADNTTRFGYNADRQPTTTTTTGSNGVVSTTAYDADDRASSSTLTDGQAGLGTVAYTRDADGDLTGMTPSGGAPGQATTYTYTKDERLSGSTVGQSTTGYAYDAAGDPTTVGAATQVFDAAGRLCWTVTGAVSSPSCGTAVSGATVYTTNGDGQRTGTTPVSGTATAYGYDGAGRLSAVSGAVAASYTYDGDGLRATATVGQATAVFTWDTTGQVPELLSDGTEFYVYGPGGRVAEQFTTGGGNPQWYFADAHGSTLALTGSAGTVDATYTYDAWGARTGHTGTASTPVGFAGAYQDAGTGFLYLQARYYDPATALFLTVDPDMQATGQAYLYASDNPLNLLDPLGLWSWGLALGIAGAVVGVAALTVATFGVGDVALSGVFAIGAAAEDVGLGSVTVGTALDATATGIGFGAAELDCSKRLSIECGLDVLSAGLGGAGLIGDIAHAADALRTSLGAGSLLAGGESLGLSLSQPEEDSGDDGGEYSERRRRAVAWGGTTYAC